MFDKYYNNLNNNLILNITNYYDNYNNKFKKINERNEEYIRECLIKQEQYDKELEYKEKLINDKLKKEIEFRKLENKRRREEELHYKNLGFKKCSKCLIWKKTDDFLNKKNLFSYDNRFGDIVCNSCLENKRIKEQLYRDIKYITCNECGIKYRFIKDEDKIKHELSNNHQKNINNLLNGIKYNIKQLRKICLSNKILNFSHMKKEEIINKLKKIPNIIIPEDI